jgi:outer membrane usher protein
MSRKAVLMATLTLTLAAAAWGQVTSPAQQRLVPLDVTVNGAKSGTWPFIERGGILHAPQDALDAWRVRVQRQAQPISYRGTEYWPLVDLPGFSLKVNHALHTAEISFAPEAFAATRLSHTLAKRPAPSPVLPSFFANYDLSYSRSGGTGRPRTTDVGALLELGASNDWGAITSSHAVRNLAKDPAAAASRGALRLETTFTRNFPESHRTLRLGDAATRLGLWGRTVYFGGVQFGTNYSLTPGYVTQPLPLLSGVSSAPSTVQLYVNDVLRQVSQVPAGPFTIDNANALTGSGEARLVVRDILGREMVGVQPFFTSPQLLAPGLADWGAEAGALRRELGVHSAEYGPAFASGTWRYGLADAVTVEARAEATRRLATAGIGAIAALPGDVLGRAALAGSHETDAGTGAQLMLGLERQWLRSSAYFQAVASSRSFRQLGLASGTLPPRLQAAFAVSHATAGYGEFGLQYATTAMYGETAARTLSVSYSLGIGKGANFSLRVSRVLGAVRGTSANATLLVPLDANALVTASVSSRGSSTDAYATATQTSSAVNDLSWRVLGGKIQHEWHSEAGLYYTADRARIYVDLSASPAQQALRVGATGGFVLADGHAFFTRRVDDSFAVAEVRGLPGIGVGLGSGVVAHTDSRGLALIPNLSAYQANQVRLSAKDLPPTAEVASIEKLVVPGWRSGVKVDFPVRTGLAALVTLRLDDGEPAPAGAVIRIAGDAAEFPVGRRGQAYVTGLRASERLQLTWKGRTCELALEVPPPGAREVSRVGPLTCSGVPR